MNAHTAASAATAHIGQPEALRRVATAWAAWRSIGASPITAIAAAFRAIA